MICEERFPYTGHPCKYPAKYMVLAPAAPRVVCGFHARQFLKGALIPLKIFGPRFDINQFPDINRFLRAMAELGGNVRVEVTHTVNIIIEFGGDLHGK